MKIKTILISPEARSHPRTEEITARFPDAKIIQEDVADYAREPGQDKTMLRLDVFKGPFVKACPCSQGVHCCGYLILSPVVGCPFSCSYCILQEYINLPAITAYVNLDDLFEQAEQFIGKHKGRTLRIGTGELADSLALEPELGYAAPMVEFFSTKENVLFELKTKSDRVESVLDLAHNGRTVIGFSMNPEDVAESEEPGAATLAQRIEASKKVIEAGYSVAFHFDPVIDLDPLAEPAQSVAPYGAVVDEIYNAVPPEKISWISLGALRFNRKLFQRLREDAPGRKLLIGEFQPGFDNKMRYLRHRRRSLLSELASMVRTRDPKAPLYLCMEDKRMVERVLGSSDLPF